METFFKTVVGFSGAATSYFFGGWSTLLELLVIFVVVDYLTGFGASGKEGKLSSKIGISGIPKKVLIFIFVFIGHKIDLSLGNGHLFRDTIIFFYLANELLSVIENAGRMGVPIPPVIQKAVEVLRSKGE
jgi:toxin secretion/phage lysis holin